VAPNLTRPTDSPPDGSGPESASGDPLNSGGGAATSDPQGPAPFPTPPWAPTDPEGAPTTEGRNPKVETASGTSANCAPALEEVAYGSTVGTALNLSDAAKARLARDCLVAVPGPAGDHDFVTGYASLVDRHLPVLITSDAVLHAYHLIFDGLLKDLETKEFRPDLVNLSAAMVEACLNRTLTVDEHLREAALRNAAFFGVALRLLDANATLPEAVAGMVAAEVASIMEHAGVKPSAVMAGGEEDFSQYVPRGHYTESEELGSYFRAMMWFGRMGFHVDNDDQLQAAILLADLWARQPAPVHAWWERVYEVTAFLVGPSDDLMPDEFAAIVADLLGPLSTNATEVLDAANLRSVRDAAEAAFRAAIISEPVNDTDPHAPEPAPAQLRFMGQRFVLDSAVFQQLVFDRVTTYQGRGMPFTAVEVEGVVFRGFPRGLDLMDALGSEAAGAVLAAEGDTQYENYDAQQQVARGMFANLTDDQWNSTAYLGWLRALQAGLADFNSTEYPAFMRGEAYAHEKLNTALGSWTTLRRDTILYVKQSYTVIVITAMPEPVYPPFSYVEPVVDLYQRVLDLSDRTLSALDRMGALSSQWASSLRGMGYLADNLTEISRAELEGTPLSSAQESYISAFADVLDAILSRVSANSRDTRLVADVHTDLNSGQVLEEATGDLSYLVALVEGPDGGWYATVGLVYSQYEFKQPLSERLTDEAWRDRVAGGDAPDVAPWVARFLEA
jgi:hypothetical protein